MAATFIKLIVVLNTLYNPEAYYEKSAIKNQICIIEFVKMYSVNEKNIKVNSVLKSEL
jgi:hypothetical protein